MVRHLVVFTLHPNISITSFFAEAEKLAWIPGVQNFECFKQISAKNNFDFGLSMQFATQELYDRYTNHPAHAAFVEEFWLTGVNSFMEIDFTAWEKDE